jgi:hypothetical protein
LGQVISVREPGIVGVGGTTHLSVQSEISGSSSPRKYPDQTFFSGKW